MTVKTNATIPRGVCSSVVTKGFSLVEVVVALGLFAFCIVAIVGLLGVGLGSTRSVINETAAINVAESIFGGWAVQTNGDVALSIGSVASNLPSLSSGTADTIYFDEWGTAQDSLEAASFQLRYTPTVLDPASRIYRLELTFRWPPERAGVTGGAVQTRSFVRTFIK